MTFFVVAGLFIGLCTVPIFSPLSRPVLSVEGVPSFVLKYGETTCEPNTNPSI